MAHKKQPDPRETKMEQIRGRRRPDDTSADSLSSSEPDGLSKALDEADDDSDEPGDDGHAKAPQR